MNAVLRLLTPLQELVCVRAAARGYRGGEVWNGEVHHEVSESVSEREVRLSAGHVSTEPGSTAAMSSPIAATELV